MNITLLLLLISGFSAALLLFQCVLQLGMKIDAGLVFGFCYFFELMGFLYKGPGSPLMLLVALPVIPVLLALLYGRTIVGDLFNSKGMWLWGLFLFYSLVSVCWAYNDVLGMNRMLILLVHGVIPGIYVYIVYRRYKVFSWTYVLLFGLAFAVIHMLYGGYSPEYPGRLTLPGSNPIYDARILFAAVTIAIWGRRIPLPLRAITIVIGLISATETQSRGPLVAFAVANLLILLYTVIRKYRVGELVIKKGIAVGLGVAFTAASFVVWHFWAEMMKVIAGSRFSVLVSQNSLSGDANFTGRKHLQQMAWDKFVEHPFFGTGLGGDNMNGVYDYPHNIVLEVLSQLGAFGMALWLISFAISLYAARRSGVWLVLILQTFGYALFSGDFGFNFEYLLVAITALAFQSVREESKYAKVNVYHYRTGSRGSGNTSHPIGNRVTS